MDHQKYIIGTSGYSFKDWVGTFYPDGTQGRDMLGCYVRHFELSGMNVNHGPIFSHSTMVLQAAVHGQGIALGNNVLAQPELDAGRLVCPFDEILMSKNAFYLVCQEKQAETGRIQAFRDWVLAKAASWVWGNPIASKATSLRAFSISSCSFKSAICILASVKSIYFLKR